jgi:phage tail-like protein
MATAAPPPPPPPPGAPAAASPLALSELYRNYNFLLRVENTEVKFTECIGLGVRIEPIRYRESGSGDVVRALPGPVAYSEVILRYGLTDSPELWNWLKNTAEGNVQRKAVTIVQLANNGTDQKISWNLDRCWPCQWSGVPFDSLGREAAIEELRLAFDHLARAT